MSRWVELSLTAAKAEYDKIKDINEQVGGAVSDGGQGRV